MSCTYFSLGTQLGVPRIPLSVCQCRRFTTKRKSPHRLWATSRGQKWTLKRLRNHAFSDRIWMIHLWWGFMTGGRGTLCNRYCLCICNLLHIPLLPWSERRCYNILTEQPQLTNWSFQSRMARPSTWGMFILDRKRVSPIAQGCAIHVYYKLV